jgi:hypothetical protein
MRALLALAASLVLSGLALASGQVDFDGSFSEARSSGGDCDRIFSVDAYHAKHAQAGPSQRTSVLKLTAEGGFFDGMVLVGLLGGSNDLFYDKTLATDGLKYEVHAEGFIDRSVLYLEFAVDGVDTDGATVCTSTATYSAFN